MYNKKIDYRVTLILLIIVLVIAFISVLTFLDYRAEKKYQECSKECLFMANNECSITCLKKYK